MIDPTQTNTTNKQNILQEWQKSLAVMHYGHNLAASYYRRIHLFLGFLVILVSVTVGTSVAIHANASLFAINLEIVLSFFAATIAGIQTFFSAKSKAEGHDRAAATFGKIRRKFEQCLYFDKTDETTLNSIRDKWNNAIQSSRSLPSTSYRKAQKSIENNGVAE